jgi:hypothetical protein
MSRKGTPEKHLPYFAFIKSLPGPGCPVCKQAAASLDEWFENLLYESANDRPLRRRFDAEHGLCGRHVHRLCASDSDGLGAAIVYRNALEAAVSALSAGKAPPVNEGACAACDHERDAEERFVGLVADFLDEKEMRAGLEASQGLCLPHVAAVIARRRDAPAWFLELHRSRTADLLGILVRYIDSFKLSTEERRAALSFEEEMAWKRLGPVMSGDGGWARARGGRPGRGGR